nr:MAG TPA: hypothetical protein [Caudoviricetes sp.]
MLFLAGHLFYHPLYSPPFIDYIIPRICVIVNAF